MPKSIPDLEYQDCGGSEAFYEDRIDQDVHEHGYTEDDYEDSHNEDDREDSQDENDHDDSHDGTSSAMNDTAALVDEAIRRLQLCNVEVQVELRHADIMDDQLVVDFMTNGCGCMKWKGNPCSEKFTQEYIRETRLNMRVLTTTELDCVLMGQIMASCNTSESVSTEGYHHATERKKTHMLLPPRQGNLSKLLHFSSKYRNEAPEK